MGPGVTQRVWKYELNGLAGGHVTDLEMPEGADALSVGMQSTGCVLWALVDAADGVPKERRRFISVFTGHPVPIPAEALRASQFVGTVQLGPLVYHVFDVGLAP